MKIRNFFNSEFGRGTLFLLIAINAFNLINFIFQFSMGRMLGPTNFGVFAVLMAIVYIYNIPIEALQNMVSRSASKIKDDGELNYFLKKINSNIRYWSIGFFILANIIGMFISKFLSINFWLIFITNMLIFSSLCLSINRGIMQGRKKFFYFGTTFILEAMIKLGLSILLVYIGFSVFGSILGVVIAAFFALVISYYFNRELFIVKPKRIEIKKEQSSYLSYFLVMTLIWISFSLDLFMAKRFFSPEIAGNYSVISFLGKILFLGTFAISKAMFPLASEKESSRKYLLASLLLVLISCIIGIVLYYLFPIQIITLLYGQEYIKFSSYLFLAAISSTILSITNIILMYSLSKNKVRSKFGVLILILAQITILSSFNSSILEYIYSTILSNIVIFIGSLFFLKSD